MGKFVHLHTHSHYSFLQALPKVDELVDHAKKLGMDALALTDAGNMHGAIEFYKEATKAGIKPILGVDAYLAERSRHTKERGEKRSRIVLLAENETGYKNLLALVSKSYLEGFFERPRMDKELLREHAVGVLALLPSFSGEIARIITTGNHESALATLAEYKSIFGDENVYLEITHHPSVQGHTEKMKRIRSFATETKTPLVAQHDVYHLMPEDREACAVLRRIQQGEKGYNEEEDFSFVREEEIREWFSDIPEAVEESGNIASRCALTFSLGNWIFPHVETKEGKTHDETLRERAFNGLKERGMPETPEVKERIEYELKIIADKGFSPYFLIVADLLSFARKAGILTTTRGSAGGSLVSYLTGVTNVDPMYFKLPFERFLNPERPKAPDIDMDFQDDRRDEIITYAKEKYGDDRVAQIGTFGAMLARAAIRDVARALGHSYGTGDRIAKLIPPSKQGFPIDIDKALSMEPDLKALYEEDEDVRQIIDIAKKIEGCVRHVGVHAAGVVIAPTSLMEWMPVQYDPKGEGKIITQYDMYSVSDEYGGVGLLKFDFLGLTNLAIIANALKRIEKTQGENIDIETIPLDDQKTFELLARGETEGIFQLSGGGMTRYLKELKPTTIHDINAMVALYRPGPMETIPAYIERKKNPRLIRFIDERMREYLDASYGLIVYQDDVLLTAINLAGYSWLDADTLRKAMGKKVPAIMMAEKEKLIKGFIEYGKITSEKAEEIWKLIEPFAAYGFNKAHAVSYGKVAYQTAYLKAHYPVEYMATLLSADAGEVERIAVLVSECIRMNIPVLPPDVNESGADFTVVGNPKLPGASAIRFGLSSIKNFGEGISEAIRAERAARGAFSSLEDFLARIDSKNLNKKSLEALILSGALDRFLPEPGGRGMLMQNTEALLIYQREVSTHTSADSLFGSALARPSLHLKPHENLKIKDALRYEKELLGIYVSGHPLDEYGETMGKAKITIKDLKSNPTPGLPVILPVLISEMRTLFTKNGEKMAFITFEDKTGSIEGVAFPRLMKERAKDLQPNTVLLIKATISHRNGEVSLALENAKPL